MKPNAVVFTYTFCVDWMCSKEQGSKKRRLGSKVHPLPVLIAAQSTNQYSKHINHEGGYDSVEDDVQDMETNRMEASSYEVVQSAMAR